jgi:lipid A ethanolaminephosphotransferase
MLKNILKNNPSLLRFVFILSGLNFILFHYPFFQFVLKNVDYKTFNGILLLSSLVVAVLIVNAFIFYLILILFRIVGKFILVLFFIINAISVYFINTYNIIIDESMIGNILNTNYGESSSFFSFKLIGYIVVFGILPSIYIIKTKFIHTTLKKFLVTLALNLLFIFVIIFVNGGNFLWIDKNAKQLVGLVMPWSYTVNTSRFYIHKSEENKKEILLPDATIKDNKKSIIVLVIGESARSQNFSLYGYNKNTNPLLSQIENLQHFTATSCATYTTAGLKCILEHKNTKDLYEILPNYLYRNNAEVIWRTTNWGEPPIHIKNFMARADLMPNCEGEGCNYDEILLSRLKEQILASDKNKILVVLHTSTSHGPTYNKKYPGKFENFKPVCNSVELGNCSQEELINAYDNTIVYTD